MRKMASIQLISEIRPIDGADSIECAKILGWNVVVKKGDYSPGDKVVFCEIDSLLPEHEEFEFLRKSSYRKPIVSGDIATVIQPGGFKIRTIKLKGQVSQGLVLSLESLFSRGYNQDLEVGTDVSDVLGIIKYEPPAATCHNPQFRSRGAFPLFLQKTDETRVQSIPEVLTQNADVEFEVREKLDGTSVTAFIRDGQFGICSRNLWLDETDDSHFIVKFANEVNLNEYLTRVCLSNAADMCIQGELIGPGIQGNRYGLRQHELYIFNFCRIEPWRKLGPSFYDDKPWERVHAVPYIGTIQLPTDVDKLVNTFARGSSSLNGTPWEGIVCRNYHRGVSFKVINPDFLLKNDD